ncbi:MAG: transcription-repair coupling factor [Bacteroidales bacterium]|nr:transcription-repair coupling factor [Bacteroidales bacterium]
MGAGTITDIINQYSNDKRIRQVRDFLSSDRSNLTINGLPASAKSVVIASCRAKQNVVVCAERDDAPYIYFDLTKIIGEDNVFFMPSSFKRIASADNFDQQNIQLRTEALSKLMGGEAVTVVTYAEAMSEMVMPAQTFNDHKFTVAVGDRLSISFLNDIFGEYGFERVDFVFQPGQYSVRGSIVDVFSFASDNPFRIDFFGDEVDSIRTFELESQLSIDNLDKIDIIPDMERESGNVQLLPLTATLSDDCAVWFVDKMLTSQLLDKFYDNVHESVEDDKRVMKTNFCTSAEWLKELKNKQINITTEKTDAETIDFGIVPQPLFKKNFDLLEDDIYFKLSGGYQIFILSDNSRQLDRLSEILTKRKRKLRYSEIKATLHEGFVDNIALRCYYTDHQIFERFHKYSLRNEKMRCAQQAITLRELSLLNVGDYVVHVDHGIGIFGGLVTTEANGRTFEAIRLTFKDNDTLLVNIQSLHRISKYRGKEGTPPKINKLGTAAWSKLKERTKKHVKDIARELIALYAKRKEEKGFAFSPDSFMQSELEASFLYEDTPDQYKASQAIKSDMERDEPMDRLICGDVGFGKTELAIRAAFKAVCDNKQVAVLVPTTILAFQHYNTFCERLKNLPCRVEYISRLRKPSEVRAILKDLEAGNVNIIIGTHRVIGKDVKFKDLGLLVIDEEQRFGVGVKEKLREMKVNVDTLTLSATPIPRTLQFSLMGARDLSVLNTPPLNRQPIVTELHTFSEDAMRNAINYEIERGGQVFIINNRIPHLYDLQAVVGRILPNVRTVVAHGQMEGVKLESIMLDFMNGEYDVLLATTIIESGLDIPNANTIIINNAHLLGLSELHQLRGRVGRSNKRAFCYLFAPPLSTLTQEARRRLQIIEEYSDLGSGFNIAMQDLDIRGTGDVLGAEQSGFISDIGYETYQKILSEALVELKQNEYKELFENENANAAEQKTPDDGYMFVSDTQIDTDEEIVFPESYISSISERMRLYKELDNIQNESDIETFRTNLIDRFGPIPDTSEQLLFVVKIRLNAQQLGIERLVLKDKTLLLYFVSDQESPFYKSPVFTAVINWLQGNSRRAQLKEAKGKLYLSVKNIRSMSEVYTLLKEMHDR